MTFLLFIKRLDELQTVRERKTNLLGKPIEDPIITPDQESLRWSRFKYRAAGEMFVLIRDKVFPFIKNLHGNRESAYAVYMKDTVFIIPTAKLLQRVVTMLDQIPMEVSGAFQIGEMLGLSRKKYRHWLSLLWWWDFRGSEWA
jgi:type I restriction enzyme M protein